jgi:hypothetical protein
MKSSYILEHSMDIRVELDMGDLILLIEYTTQASEVVGASHNSTRAATLLKSLKKTKKDAAESAVRDFQRMVDAD